MPIPKSRSELIFDHAQKFATPLRTTLGHTWAIVPEGSGRYHGYPIPSQRFEQWLAHSFHTEHSIYPGRNALENAVRMFAAHARHSDFPTSDVFTRLGWRGDRRLPQSVLLHLANANNELVEITPHGHHIVTSESWHFLAGPAILPLPRPIDNSATLRDHLRPLLNLDGPALDRAIVWLFATLRPSPPYPALIISGPPGSGKSMLARMLRHLVDPSSTSLLMPPLTERDLFTLALHHHILAFDHARALPARIIDSLARISTGAGLGLCRRNIFDAPEPLPLGRPILMTVPADRRIAIGNALRIELAPIDAPRVSTETCLAQKLQAAAPAILGTLCAAVTAALSNTAATAESVSRFADVHHWTTAAAPILGLTGHQINVALAANTIVDALHVLLDSQPEWTGTSTKLLQTLEHLGFAALAANATHLSEQLNSSRLELFGITQRRTHTGSERQIHLTLTSQVSVSSGHARGINAVQ
jgi:hypothetical protein